jgi:EmrB/QacA subfamily drug resistance transporter
MCACVAVVIGMVTAINLAVPSLGASSLHPSASALLWIVDTYVVLFACLVILGGAAGDRFGRKRVLLGGLGLFAVGSLVCGVAPSVPVMLVGRAITGIGGAFVLPNTLAILVVAVPVERRGRAIAAWASMTGLGGVLGNVVGGALLTAGSWRWLFLAAVPIALACAGWVAFAAPTTSRHARPLQPLSALLLTLACLALLIGIIQGPEDGWTSPTVIAGFALAAVLLAVWATHELRSAHPLLDPRLFRIGRLRRACTGLLGLFLATFSFFYLNASFLQYGRGWSVLLTGVAIVPMTAAIIVGSRLAGRAAARVGAAATLAVAFALVGVGLLALSRCTGATPYAVYAVVIVAIGLGLGLALPGLSADIAGSLPPDQAGVGSGLQATTRELGAALGVAIVGTIVTSRFVSGLPASLRDRSDPPHTVAEALASVHTAADRAVVLHAFVSAADSGFAVVGILTAVVGAVVVGSLRRRAAE